MPFFTCGRCGTESPLPDGCAGFATCPRCGQPVAEEPEASTQTRSLCGEEFRQPEPLGPREGVLKGRYRLGEEIGRGGMGWVVRAFDSTLGRDIAIKFMLDRLNEDAQRFVREAHVTGQLEHPNIVPVHDLGVDARGRPFLAMKLVRGRSLAAILRRLRDEPGARAGWPLGRLLGVLVGVCHALEYAHDRGVLHRDLKPSNVMVGDFGEVYVMDWGVAKVGADRPRGPTPSVEKADDEWTTETTLEGSVVGTPAYMPPEQAAGRVGDLDARGDVYSLGAILYSMLTYLPPVETGGDRRAVLGRAAAGEIVPPSGRVGHRVPRELCAVAMKALAKDPADRYQTAAAFRRDVELFLEGRAVSARDDTAWDMLARFVRRNRGFSAATLVSAALLGAVVGVSFWVTDAARRGAEQAYRALRDEQDDKRERLRASAPAFVRAARLLANDRQFGAALAETRVAREYDPGRAEAHLLEGTMLIALGRYGEAAGPLHEYCRLAPDDPLARELESLGAHPEPESAAYFNRLGAIFEARRDFVLVQEMARRSERLLGPVRDRLPAYRKRVEAAWPGCGRLLRLDRNGELVLEFTSGVRRASFVKDSRPLEGIPLDRLEIQGGEMESLAPLRGMPLVLLDLQGCKRVEDLSPLRGMRLRDLSLFGATGVADLAPLHGMPLRKLNLRGCRLVTDLSPLRDSPLSELVLMDCPGVRDLSPLTGMSLTRLSLMNCNAIEDLSPLRGMPLRSLDLHGLPLERHPDLEPLAGMPLTTLDIAEARVTSLKTLEGMPLAELIIDKTKVEDLSPLRGMKLTSLSLYKTAVRDLAPLRGMPLTHLNLGRCPHLKDLEFVRGMKLESLFAFNEYPLDLSPLAGMDLKSVGFNPCTATGVEVLRTMPSLRKVDMGRGSIPADRFWKLYDKGEIDE